MLSIVYRRLPLVYRRLPLVYLFINQMVKSPYDPYGCCVSCGYTWCETLKECVRVWETYCESLEIGH